MSFAKAGAIIGALAGAFSLGFPRVKAEQAGTKRALKREALSRKARAALYADTPACPASRQAKRHALRMAAKDEAARQLIIERRASVRAKRDRARDKAPIAKAA